MNHQTEEEQANKKGFNCVCVTSTWPWPCIPSTLNISCSVGPIMLLATVPTALSAPSCYYPRLQLSLPFNVSLFPDRFLSAITTTMQQSAWQEWRHVTSRHVTKCRMPHLRHFATQYPQYDDIWVNILSPTVKMEADRPFKKLVPLQRTTDCPVAQDTSFSYGRIIVCLQTNICHRYHNLNTGRERAFRIGTRYRLDGPGIEFRWRRDIPHLFSSALGPPSLPCNGDRVSFLG